MKYLLCGLVALGILSGCESTRLYTLEQELRANFRNINESLFLLADEIYHLKRKLRVTKRRK